MTGFPPPPRERDPVHQYTDTAAQTSAWEPRPRWWSGGQRVFQGARRVWDRAVHVVTPAGGFVVLAALGAGALGALFRWVEAWGVAIAAALLVLAAIPFLAGKRSIELRLAADQSRVVAGSTVTVIIEAEETGNRPSAPTRAELPVGPALRELAIPGLAAHGRTTLTVAVPAPHRGVISVGPLSVTRRDPVGLLRRELSWPDRHRVHVHPVTTQLPPTTAGLVRDLEGDPSRRLTTADLSFHAVREYVPGDARRHMHWRSTAKTGTLMVRQYEESQTAQTAVLFDSHRAEYVSGEAFELGVSVAASLGLQAIRGGRERFIATQALPGQRAASATRLAELPSRTPTQFLDSWARLTARDHAAPIEQLARELRDLPRALSLVAVVTGSLVDSARLRTALAVFPRDVAVLIVRCAPLADPAARGTAGGTVLTVGALADLPQLLARRSSG